MNKIETKKLYKDAVEKWGLPLQFGMLMEECAELIQATNKIMRKESPESWKQLAEEMADVEIMIDQLKSVINWQNLETHVAEYKEEKLQRLKKRIEEN